MPDINESGRKKLAIIKVGEVRQVGQAEVKEFFAKVGEPTGDAPQVKYGVWSSPKMPSPLYEYIKEGTTIDCDVITKKSEKVDPDGNPYWNRKVTQIYVDGKPIEEKKQFAGGYRGDSPEQRRSIERQVSAKLMFEIAPEGASIRDCLVLAEHIYQWIAEGKLPPPVARSGGEPEDTRKKQPSPEAAKPPAESKDTGRAEESPPAAKAKAETTGLEKIEGIDMDWLDESLNKLARWKAGAWLREHYPKAEGQRIRDIVKSLTVEQRKEFGREVLSRVELL